MGVVLCSWKLAYQDPPNGDQTSNSEKCVEISGFAEANTGSISNLPSSPRRLVIGQVMMDNRLIILTPFFSLSLSLSVSLSIYLWLL